MLSLLRMDIAEHFFEFRLFFAELSENWGFSHTMSIVSYSNMTYDHRQQGIVYDTPHLFNHIVREKVHSAHTNCMRKVRNLIANRSAALGKLLKV